MEILALGSDLPELTLDGSKGATRSGIALYGDTLGLEASYPGAIEVGRRQDTVDETDTRGEGLLVGLGLRSRGELGYVREPLQTSPEEELELPPRELLLEVDPLGVLRGGEHRLGGVEILGDVLIAVAIVGVEVKGRNIGPWVPVLVEEVITTLRRVEVLGRTSVLQ